ncbi:hypothetical protein EB796_015854 [Bugula neritina]|uniref:Reverse transcriptase domain-containing protein n=1 Tax=Bugula neritina TaxID=10212 RepID=A0A7J7JK25_BUGNE|nr:hypothetical protein EB796_015854 [Bugula neritina]
MGEAGKDMMTPANDEEYTDTPTQRRLLNSHFELLLKNIDFDLLHLQGGRGWDTKHSRALLQNIFETKSVIDSPHLEAQQVRNELLLPVTEAEVKGVLVKKSRGSPGYDGYTWKDLKKVNISILVSCCNLWLLSGMAPTGMAKGITTLIPKVIGTANPGEFRPITVTSTFSRLYHCILGEIFSNTLPYNDRQKGFKKGDGLYFNTKLLQRTISEAKAN